MKRNLLRNIFLSAAAPIAALAFIFSAVSVNAQIKDVEDRMAPAPFPSTVPVIQASYEHVESFISDITINQDASLNIVETINYDFGSTQHHGIFRTIPYKYEARGGSYKLRVGDFKVVDDKDQAVEFHKSSSGGKTKLTIGDPNTTISGKHTYKVSYTVKRAINYFDDHDELYWNINGLEWEVPFNQVSAVVHAPAAITQMKCYTGAANSTEQSCTIKDGNTKAVTFTTSKPLDSNENMTIVVGVPTGTVAKPTLIQKIIDTTRDNGILLLPILVFFLMYRLWSKYGRDAVSKNPIVAQYEGPEKLSPLYMGTLVHNGTSNKDIAAEVVYLAEQGYMTIDKLEVSRMLIFKGTDYEFNRTDKPDNALPAQSKKLLNLIFPGDAKTKALSELKHSVTFGSGLSVMKSSVMSELVKEKYYRFNPTTVRLLWTILAIFGTVALSFVLGALIGYLGTLSAIVSGLVVIIFSFIMPARTQKGADTVTLVDGLELYLSVAEKDRLAFHSAPEKSPKHFESLLPFAIALGVETAWANQFHDLTQAPTWYRDPSGSAFNAMAFSSSMNSFSSSVAAASTAATSSASSGGSGFSGGGSGGGFGGGGGGSW